MARSFLTHNSGILDLQTIFDSQSLLQQQQQLQQQQHQQPNHLYHQDYQQHQHQQQQRLTQRLDFTLLNDFEHMDYNCQIQTNRSTNPTATVQLNNNHNSNHNLHLTQQTSASSSNNNSNSNSNSSDSSTNNIGHQNQISISNRNYMNGYQQQHQQELVTPLDYEQVIHFVDSPPISEESWGDRSKDSPGPQIIEVQTICADRQARKKRMEWGPLDIGQVDSGASTPNGEPPAKIANLEHHHQQEKEKHKRATGRKSWNEDPIGFDLNGEFSSNSYLTNESFLQFSPALVALKQEPHTPLNGLHKLEKSPVRDVAHSPHDAVIGDGGLRDYVVASPQGSPLSVDYELSVADKTASNGNGVDNRNRGTGARMQQLSAVNDAKLGNSTINCMSSTQQVDANKDLFSFQYILGAPTSVATRANEETLTYLNQGQSYEIKLTKIGDLSFYRDKILKSVIKVCFHERRLQFREREKFQQWQESRPGERIIEVDVPLSCGLYNVSQSLNTNPLNVVEVFWDPMKEVGVYVKVNCISTEFTPKKHGGEKGVPFRLQIETYIDRTKGSLTGATQPAAPASPIAAIGGATSSTSTIATATTAATSTVNFAGTSPAASPAVGAASAANLSLATPNGAQVASSNNNNAGTDGINTEVLSGKQAIHAAACQIKVFKLKGAERKHKQDRERIEKRRKSDEVVDFHDGCSCTLMTNLPIETLMGPDTNAYSPEYIKIWPNSPVHMPKYDGVLSYANVTPTASSSPIGINAVTSTNSPSLKLMDTSNMVSPQHSAADIDEYAPMLQCITPDSSPVQVAQWLKNHRLQAYLTTFANFGGADIMRMSKDDLTHICGMADGIRMYNILSAKPIAPRLTLYVGLDGIYFSAVYLISNTVRELTQKLCKLPGFYEALAKTGSGGQENGNGVMYDNWGMHSKYSGSNPNVFGEMNRNLIYVTGPAGVHVCVTDEVLNNEIKNGSLYVLDLQAGKIVLQLFNKKEI